MSKIKSKVKNIEECTKLFDIIISLELVNKTLEDVYGEIKKIAKVPGYRPGTIPQDLLEKYHALDAREEVLKRLVPEGYKSALERHGITPISFPEVTDIEFQKGKPLSFKAKVDTRPQIKLANYKNLRVKKDKVSVEEKEVEEALSKIQVMNAKYITVDNRPVEKGDYVICDIEVFCEGKPISRKNENIWVMANKDASLLGMGEALAGMERGQSKEITVRLPSDYVDKKYQDKEATFKVAVKDIKIRKLPAIDDELAKDMGKENMGALREEVVKTLFARKEEDEAIREENQILETLLNSCRFSVPGSMVEKQHKALLKRLENELLSKGMHKDMVEGKKKEFSGKLKADAENKVRIYFLLEEIAAKENITVQDSDIDARLAEIAKATNQSAESVREYYKKNELLDGMAEQIREEKTLAFLLKNAEVVEK